MSDSLKNKQYYISLGKLGMMKLYKIVPQEYKIVFCLEVVNYWQHSQEQQNRVIGEIKDNDVRNYIKSIM